MDRRVLETIASSIIREIFSDGAKNNIIFMIERELRKKVPEYDNLLSKHQKSLVAETHDFLRMVVGL